MAVHVDILDLWIVNQRLESAKTEERIENRGREPLLLNRIERGGPVCHTVCCDCLEAGHRELPGQLTPVRHGHLAMRSVRQVVGDVAPQRRDECIGLHTVHSTTPLRTRESRSTGPDFLRDPISKKLGILDRAATLMSSVATGLASCDLPEGVKSVKAR